MQPFESPSAWRGLELDAHDDWRHTLGPAEIDEIKTALDRLAAREASGELAPGGLSNPGFGVEDFELPTLGPRLRALGRVLEDGPGLVYLKGWPAERFDTETNARVFWGPSRHLGTPISQSAQGERIFRVEDSGLKFGHPKARGPNTRKELRFHCDRCDVIGFLCVRQARQGGENYLVSSIEVHNEILARRPDLLEELYRPWYYKTHNVDTANDDPWCHQPIFAIEQGQFVGYVLRVLIDRAYELPELPDMTPKQKEALDFLDQVCAEPAIHYSLRQEPGDLLFVNNFTTFHSRSEFDDYPEPERKRLLLRIWLSMPDSRPLPASFAGSFGHTGAGELRGGIHPSG